jgi:hypothetical protein
MAECKKRSDWDKWKEAIEVEIASLNKRKVFSAVRPTPPGILPVGYKWVFVRKRNKNNEVVRYKARLVAQGFTQRPGVDFNETYSLGHERNNVPIFNLIGSTKSSIYAVDGRSDRIFIRITGF